MADEAGPTDHPLIEDILRDPRRYQFLKAVWLLEKLGGGAAIGGDGPVRDEAIRFRADASLAFPTTDLADVSRGVWPMPFGRSASRFQITASFLGIYGSSSPLPSPYSEVFLRSVGDTTDEDRDRLRAFVDIFHHRLYSLFYRAMMKYRFPLVYDPRGGDPFTERMLALVGHGTENLPEPKALDRRRLIRYAGLVTQHPKSAEGVRGILADFLNGIKVSVEQCVGRWFRLDEGDLCRLGTACSSLGSNCVVGSAAFDRTGKFQVVLGPMSFRDFLQFLPRERLAAEEPEIADYLPKRALLAEIRELIRIILVDDIEFDVATRFRGEETPRAALGVLHAPALLGWTAWMADPEPGEREVVFA